MSHQFYKAWLSSFRLQTLPLAVATILIANALAYWHGKFSFQIFGLTLLTAILLQITSNLANDYGDFSKQTDTLDRIGPLRGIHQGIITLGQLRVVLCLTICISVLSGLWLLVISTQSIEQLYFFIALGALSIIAAVTYTVGKKPYGYIGLGDLSVLIFFGFVGIMGSYYLQTNEFGVWLILPAIFSGFLSMGVLNINNMRDYDQDDKAGKRTLVVIMGLSWAKSYQISLLLTSLGVLMIFVVSYLPLTSLWIFIILVPLYLRQVYELSIDNRQIGDLLIPMVRLNLSTALLLSLAIIFSVP
ncbi:1,4-dihydroxy-2-naphthoate octaprenyltransferase [Wohlfahrtiimonas larvae]|uniref:1,4-dihydroxy-2-naphthoate octaprenyltransferase n=1 Tax=Wohlfahrtiimonas larvae TaxID=1157986 RepID=A0ABP9MWR5_9GAMM|nr:1,4-dihydroxy-2-naphthoate octaprenyltransferase [Wohlfahrtiimonas larvae]